MVVRCRRSEEVEIPGKPRRAQRQFLMAVFLLLLVLTPALAATVRYEYDDSDRLVRVEYDDGTITEYTYDSVGNRLTKTTVRGAMDAEFSLAPSAGLAPLTVNFTNLSTPNVTAWLWDFGDGNTSMEQNPTHTYTTVGAYTVTLRATSPAGTDTEAKIACIEVIPFTGDPPVADFMGEPTMGLKPLTVNFTSYSTGEITAYQWDFGDGSHSTLQNPAHTYQNAGMYTVSLAISGPSGLKSIRTTPACIIVDETPPVANFTVEPTNGLTPLAVRFTSTSTGVITEYYWDFGDGDWSTAPNPAHLYSTGGSYSVSLTVSGPGGSDTKWSESPITVTFAPPVAGFIASPTSGLKPLEVQFECASTGEITSRQWDFGDGTGSSDWYPFHLYESAGTFSVSLTVTGPGGSNTATKTGLITVGEPPPVADFYAETTNGVKPLSVAFINTSTGAVSNNLWDFGDGTTSTDPNPTHVYATAGTFTVTLTVTGPGGSHTNTLAGYIIVDESPPAAHFTPTPTSGLKPLQVHFSNTSTGAITDYSWDFGDGGWDNAPNPTHTYDTSGTFTAGLTVSGPGGSDYVTTNITVNEPAPVANFTATPTSGMKPLPVYFTDTSMGEITSYLWDFGDGSTDVSAYAYHEYNSAGSFTVRLTVTGPGGSHTKTVPNYITVSEPPPLADFIANPNMGLKPLTVSFASTSTGAITSYLWDFGDGTGANVANPVHIYNNAGVYTVRLTVNGPGGSDTSTQFGCIGVDEPPPVAGIAASPTSGVQPLTVTFTSTSTGAISDYYWDFGDGTYSTAPNVSHIYGYAGTYTAGLWVSGPGGSDSAAMTITVNVPPPVATFTASPRAGDEPLAVSFSNTSTGAITSCYWTFGDGTHGTAWSPSHTYRSVGVFDVTLTVTGPGGSASRVKNDFITVTYAPPVAQFSATPRSGAAPLAVSFTDTSTGEITAWSWNFGDGRTSVARNPVRTFSNPGTYTIKLTVTGPGGSNTRTKAGYITVR